MTTIKRLLGHKAMIISLIFLLLILLVASSVRRHRNLYAACNARVISFKGIGFMIPFFLKCDSEKATFQGIDIRFPITMLEAKKEYDLTFLGRSMGRVFSRTTTKYGNQISEGFQVLCPLNDGERYWREPSEEAVLNRQANCYSFFFLSINGDSLRKKLESDFARKFELRENRLAKSVKSKFTTCYEMKVNDCLYVATSNFGKGKVVTWVTFTYGLDEYQRSEFRH